MKKSIFVLCALLALCFCAAALADVTLEQAKEIALQHANVSAEHALFTKAHMDYDDGREVYDIEFYVGGTEYEFDIDAATGAVTEYSVENHGTGILGGTSQVTEEQAKQIALAHAGFKAEDVTFVKSKLDRDDGRDVYEIEFIANNLKYEYDIDAASGRIREFDIDD